MNHVETIQQGLERRARGLAEEETRGIFEAMPCVEGIFKLWSPSENKVVDVNFDAVLYALREAIKKRLEERHLKTLTEKFMANFDRLAGPPRE